MSSDNKNQYSIPMPDLQQSRDTRNIAIDKVGIKNIRYPIVVLDKFNEQQHTVAWVNMYVDLPEQFKGTHMSRFIEVLNLYHGEISIENMEAMLIQIKSRLGASRAHLEFDFPYFIKKQAPVSGAYSLLEYQCRMIGTMDDSYKFSLEVEVPVTSLCPCSKEISDRGAHNQRSNVTVHITYSGHVWLEDLIQWIEECASCPVYSLLKREDEKAVTEQAYDNPMFVEDMVRAVTEKLRSVERIDWFKVQCENFESIHNHSAYAMLERKNH
jgi:GTP cyclohydrolase I